MLSVLAKIGDPPRAEQEADPNHCIWSLEKGVGAAGLLANESLNYLQGKLAVPRRLRRRKRLTLI